MPQNKCSCEKCKIKMRIGVLGLAISCMLLPLNIMAWIPSLRLFYMLGTILAFIFIGVKLRPFFTQPAAMLILLTAKCPMSESSGNL